jgi:hypothetical protein
MSHKNAVILADLLSLRMAGKRPKWPVFITEYRVVAETCEALGLPWLWLGDKRFERDWIAMKGLDCVVVYVPKTEVEHSALERSGARILKRFGFYGFMYYLTPYLRFESEVA